MLWWNFEIIYMDCLKNLFGKMEDGGGVGGYYEINVYNCIIGIF